MELPVLEVEPRLPVRLVHRDHLELEELPVRKDPTAILGKLRRFLAPRDHLVQVAPLEHWDHRDPLVPMVKLVVKPNPDLPVILVILV